jgi:hypothetical protein
MALFHHGYRRFTEDVDLLVTREGLKRIHEELDGLSYLPQFAHGKNLRDVDLGVKIEFLVAGDFPGDGKPKPVAFPHPTAEGEEFDGIRFINLKSLIELKLASGMTAPARMRDLSDVVELIKALNLPADYAIGLNPYVQAKFHELWHSSQRRFLRLWPIDASTAGAQTLDELIDKLSPAADELRTMKADGVFLEPDGGRAFARLITIDPIVAAKYGMAEASEFMDDPEGA